jgi:hypothetical protein
VVNNRTRLLSGVARAAFKLRAEVVERGFALILDRGGMRRAWLRGRENLHKRYLIHVAGYNLGLIMRLLTGAGTPREFRARVSARFAAAVTPAGSLFVLLIVVAGEQTAAVALSIEPDHSSERGFLNGLIGHDGFVRPVARPGASGRRETRGGETEGEGTDAATGGAAAGERAYSFQGRRCHSARSDASIAAIIAA